MAGKNKKERVALGMPMIQSDTIFFRSGDETWELPTFMVAGKFAHFNGIHYEAKVKDIKRFLEKNYG